MKFLNFSLLALFLFSCAQPQAQTSSSSTVEPLDCATVDLPEPNPAETIACVQTQTSFCGFFPNGKPFYCAAKNGTLTYRSNKWGSSLTVSTFDTNGQQLSERYYAYGKLTRGADYNVTARTVTRFWWDEDGQIRLYRYDFNNRVLDKYYFREGKEYVRYPDGNDMGEINGPWKMENLTLYIDHHPFYTLPDPAQPAPDMCSTFEPLCEQKI